jgi:hypothetical protein
MEAATDSIGMSGSAKRALAALFTHNSGTNSASLTPLKHLFYTGV